MKLTDVSTLPRDAGFRDMVFVKSAESSPIGQDVAATSMRTIFATPLPGYAIGARPGAPRL